MIGSPILSLLTGGFVDNSKELEMMLTLMASMAEMNIKITKIEGYMSNYDIVMDNKISKQAHQCRATHPTTKEIEVSIGLRCDEFMKRYNIKKNKNSVLNNKVKLSWLTFVVACFIALSRGIEWSIEKLFHINL